MKKVLFDFKYKRNFWEACVFFVINTIYLVLFGMIFAFVYMMFVGNVDDQFKTVFTPIARSVFIFLVSFYVVNKKGLVGMNKWSGLIILAVWLSYSSSGYTGLLVASLLSTAKPIH